jgi:hypothetical protein
MFTGVSAEDRRVCEDVSADGEPACHFGKLSVLKDQPQAVCGEHFTGFRCSECEEEWAKVDGECVPCPGLDWLMGIYQGLQLILTAFILLHSSTLPTMSANEITKIWHKLDGKNQRQAKAERVRAMLAVMGTTLTTSDNHAKARPRKCRTVWCGMCRSACVRQRVAPAPSASGLPLAVQSFPWFLV